MKVALTKTAAAASFAFALAISAVPAFAQYYNQNDRVITGTVSAFDRFNLTLQTNGSTRRDEYQHTQRRHGNGHGHGNGNGNDGNNNGRWHNENNNYNNTNCERDDDGDRNECGDENNNGRWNTNNGGYSNGGWYNNNGLAVHLHQGTIINPTGTTLQPGMNIRIYGHPNNDGTFEADRIDVQNGYYRGY